jgi:uncharacterized short protein YbdD (DUF466 family)
MGKHCGQSQVEPHMEIGYRACRALIDHSDELSEPRQRGQGKTDAESAIDKITHWDAPRRRIAARSALKYRVDGSPKVRAKHESEGGHRRDDAFRRERHDDQDNGDRGMSCPGRGGAEEGVDKRLRRELLERMAQSWRILIGLQEVDELMERQEDEAKPDEHAPKIA